MNGTTVLSCDGCQNEVVGIAFYEGDSGDYCPACVPFIKHIKCADCGDSFEYFEKTLTGLASTLPDGYLLGGKWYCLACWH